MPHCGTHPLVCKIEIKRLKMKKNVIFLIIFVLVFIVNGNANETVSINFISYDNSPSVGEIQKFKAKTNLASEYEQNNRAILETITMLILGVGLISLGTFIRKKLLYRGSLKWQPDYGPITGGDDLALKGVNSIMISTSLNAGQARRGETETIEDLSRE